MMVDFAEEELDFVLTQEDARDLYVVRNEKWGSAWTNFSMESLVNMASAKLQRADLAGKAERTDDIRDSLQDAMNYITFALMKLDKGY